MSTSENSRPTLSAELFVIPLDESKFIVYVPLRQAAFVANARIVNFLADLKAGQYYNQQADTDGGLVAFLRGLGILDAGEEILPITTFKGVPAQTSLTLFLTTACNLRCTYCYAASGDTPTKIMDLKTAKRGIDFVARNAVLKKSPGFEVNFHGGGEPTVNWRTLTGAMEYAQKIAGELSLNLEASSATNGLLNEEQIAWVVANLQGASISFDGLPSVHDKHRPTVGGKDSSERVMHTIRHFDAEGFPYGIRMTVTADQIPLMADSVEFICSSFNMQHIQVEPAYQLGRGGNAPSAETKAFIDGFREAQSRAQCYGKEIFFSGARLGILTNHFCGISQDTFALSPDGNVSSCYEVFSEENNWANIFFYGNPDELSRSYIFDLEKLTHLRQQAVQNREYCQGCFAKWTCAGDCYHKSLTANGSLEFSGSDRCTIIREITKDQILARIVASGGLFWHEQSNSDQQSISVEKEMLL